MERLREIYRELAAQGAHNINLVTPSHFADAVLESLTPAPPVPVVYNTNGYESVDSLRRFQGKVQIYLPDVKYSDDSLAVRCSRAPDYFRTAKESVLEMFRQTGPYRMNAETGLLESGVVIRHLVLPGQLENTFGVIDWVRDAFKPGDVLFSLMRQYVPCGRAADFPDLNRKLTEEEYQAAEDYLFSTDIEDGFVQEGEAASESFIPAFDGSGV